MDISHSGQDLLNTAFRKREEIVSRDIAGETILVPIRGKIADMQRIFSLNPVAAFIWAGIDGEKTVDVLIAEIIRKFDVAREEAERDTLAFIRELLGAELIEVGEK